MFIPLKLMKCVFRNLGGKISFAVCQEWYAGWRFFCRVFKIGKGKKSVERVFWKKDIRKKNMYIYIITCMTVLSFDYYYIAIPGIYHFLFDSTLECSFIHLRWVLLRFNRFFLYWHGEKRGTGLREDRKWESSGRSNLVRQSHHFSR